MPSLIELLEATDLDHQLESFSLPKIVDEELCSAKLVSIHQLNKHQILFASTMDDQNPNKLHQQRSTKSKCEKKCKLEFNENELIERKIIIETNSVMFGLRISRR